MPKGFVNPQLEEIRAAIRRGETTRKIAERFNMTTKAIYSVRAKMMKKEQLKKVIARKKAISPPPRGPYKKKSSQVTHEIVAVSPVAAPAQMKLIMGSPQEIAAMLKAMGK